MLRDLTLSVRGSSNAMAIERGAELRNVTHSAHSPEGAACLEQSGADPAQHHLAVTPALDVAGVMRDCAVQVYKEMQC